MRVVAIMAVRNRREMTLRTVVTILSLTSSKRDLHVVVFDDGSTDGTPDALEQCGERCTVIGGDGSFFWARSMQRAEQVALSRLSADFVLWLNDDAALDVKAIDRALAAAETIASGAILVGALSNPTDPRECTYGGLVRRRGIRVRFQRLGLSERDQECHTFNGNFVIVPRSAALALGGIDGSFSHHYADFDYGLRATRLGIPVIQFSGAVGAVSRNPIANTYEDSSASRRQRYQHLVSPKGLPPRDHARFLRRHGGVLWPLILLLTYGKLIWRVARRR